MTKWFGRLAAACSLAATAESSLACVLPPPIAPLPNESPQDFKARQDAMLAAEKHEFRRVAQSAMLDQSSSTFVGVVSATREIPVGAVKGHEVTVRPLAAIKGELPSAPVIVKDTIFTDCGISGGGSATSAQPGDYVIVFSGLAPTELRGANVGIAAKEAELADLIGALTHYALVSRH